MQTISDARVEAEARAKQARQAIEQLDARKRRYEAEDIAGKMSKVDSVAAWETELKPLKQQLDDLEKEVKSLTETFTAMETEARNQAREQKSELDDKKPGIYESFGKRKEALIEAHGENLKAIRLHHEPELDTANTKVTDLKTQKAGLEVEVEEYPG